MLSREKLVPISEAHKLFPNRPHQATVFRWATKGVRGVRLETVRIGGRRYTSEEATDRFNAALNGREATSESHDEAATELEKAGL